MKKKLTQLFTTILVCSISILNAQESKRTIDSLLTVLKNLSENSREIKLVSGSDTTKINVLNRLGKYYLNTGNYEQGLNFCNQAKYLAQDIGYPKGEAGAHGIIGIIYDQKGDYKNSLDNHLKALEIRKHIGDKRGVASSSISIGVLYVKLGNYEKAMEDYLSGLKILEELGEKKATAIVLNNIGNIYFKQNNYEKALDYYNRSLKTQLEIGDKEGAALAYGNIGSVYSNQGRYDDALDNHIKCLEICRELDDNEGIAICYNNMGTIYEEKGGFEKALDYQFKSLKIVEETGNPQLAGMAYNGIASVYKKQKKFQESLRYFNKALVVFKTIGYKEGVENVYIYLSELHSKMGGFKKAYEFHKLYADLKDSLLNEKSSKQISEMNVKYESEKKEKEIELLTKDKNLQQAEISKQKLIRNGIVGGLVLALIFAFVLFNRFRVIRKQKMVIEYQNNQIVESINYSKKIQDSLLPSIDVIQKSLPDFFIYNSPKDIVSGDFYFFKEYKNYILVTCVDCTGHGVPGGFMSTLGSLLLDKITDEKQLSPSEILNKLSEEIIRVLHQQSGGEIQDGMDLSVCVIDKVNRKINFSGARNGIIVVSNGEAKRYKANSLPVGGNYTKKGIPLVRNFETQQIAINSTDWIYMYTDGFIEQVGGLENEPMSFTQFENQLINISTNQMVETKINSLQSELDNWRGLNERTDDVLIIGFQV